MYSKKDTCVLCEQVEDHEHVLTCQVPVATEFRNNLFEILENEHIKLDTHPDLIMLSKMGVNSVKTKIPLEVEGNPEKIDMR